MLEYLRSREHLTGTRGQKSEYFELLGGQIDLLSAQAHLVLVETDFDIARLVAALARNGLCKGEI